MIEPATDRRGVLAWFASNHVAANLLMWIVVVTGVLSLWRIKVEVFQEIDPQLIRVTVPYAGATPCEVEEGICLRVEEAIKGIEGIERVRSVANSIFFVFMASASLTYFALVYDLIFFSKSKIFSVV